MTQDDDYDDDEGPSAGGKVAAAAPTAKPSPAVRPMVPAAAARPSARDGEVELPVLVTCADGEVILHFSELFGKSEEELARWAETNRALRVHRRR